mmetsp:Transcript_102813/g.286259  ORF Transcript_102813/g.286259 Transcript_102813/m.286259 type:complete len:380 (+) Transcript_102813:84-1223(+)
MLLVVPSCIAISFLLVSSNVHGQNVPAKADDCCVRLEQEGAEACLELEIFGLTTRSCDSWRATATQSCMDSGRNCTHLAETLRDWCQFSLQVVMNWDLATMICSQMALNIMKYRCPAACHIAEDECKSQEALHCMRRCGNFAGCSCRLSGNWWTQGAGATSVCSGTTILTGHVPNQTGVEYSCLLVPPECHHHIASPCGKFKHCDADLCIVKSVVCSASHQCAQRGWCDPESGNCEYTNQPDEYPCEDGLEYTMDDRCINGTCVAGSLINTSTATTTTTGTSTTFRVAPSMNISEIIRGSTSTSVTEHAAVSATTATTRNTATSVIAPTSSIEMGNTTEIPANTPMTTGTRQAIASGTAFLRPDISGLVFLIPAFGFIG